MDNKLSKIESLTSELLDLIGEDLNREGIKKTPFRVAKSWEFFSQGYRKKVDDVINDAIFNEKSKDLIVVRDIEFFSLCEHHMIPFFGRAHVGLSLIHI